MKLEKFNGKYNNAINKKSSAPDVVEVWKLQQNCLDRENSNVVKVAGLRDQTLEKVEEYGHTKRDSTKTVSL